MHKGVALVGSALLVVGFHGFSIGLSARPMPQHDSHSSTAPSSPAPATPVPSSPHTPSTPTSPAPAVPVEPITAPSHTAGTEVRLTSPVPNARVRAGSLLGLAATATSTTSSERVTQVEFLANNVLIGTDRSAPFTMAWTPSANTYSLKAVGRTISGAQISSPAVTVFAESTTVAPAPSTPSPPATMPSLPAQPLLQQSSLVYEGAFAVPYADGSGGNLQYSGKGLAFNRERGTLFLAGEETALKAAEVRVPQVRVVATMAELAVAPIAQPMADPTDGRYDIVGDRAYARYGGLLPYKGKLYTNVYHYYDANGWQPASIYVSGQNLSVPNDTSGPYKVGELKTGYTSGYMTEIPLAWQAALGGPVLIGNCCLSIVSRTSYGPAAFAFDPENVGVADPIPAAPLLYYPDTNPLDGVYAQSLSFNMTTLVEAVVFPEGTRTVLFFGRQGIGPFCYGSGCFPGAGQGPHAAPYVARVWAYDAAEFAQVKAGLKKPWDVKPYALWELNLPFEEGWNHLRGAAYDPATKRLFIAQPRTTLPALPVIHVFRLP